MAAVGVALIGLTVKAVPLQVVADCAGITGVGFTVTAKVFCAPVHPLLVGVIT